MSDMDWLIRFWLGLPARSEDRDSVLRVLPELQATDFELKNRNILWLFHSKLVSSKDLINELKSWVAEIDTPALNRSGQEKCPAENSNGESLVVRLMVAGGGPKVKPPKDSFIDLVKKVHSKSGKPREVILTDPYIYAGLGADGLNDGSANLVFYLEALGLNQDDAFTLTTTPSPKRGTKATRSNLQGMLRKKFKRIEFKDFSPKLEFHDRFYIVHHQSGATKAIFGPSLNGLSSNAIVLMGDIDEGQPLKKIKDWLG